jgi:hypothetical protein
MVKSFLLIGIAWDQLKEMVGEEAAPKMTEMVKSGIAKDTQAFKDAGLELEFIDYGTEEPMARLEGKLAEKEYKGVAM